MRKILLVTFIIILSLRVSAQQYQGEFIIKKADSIIIHTIGQRAFDKYYSFDSSTYYTYKNFLGNTKLEVLKPNKNTKGKLINVYVRYNFCLGLYGCCVWNSVPLDNNLILIKAIDTSFIPRYIINNSSSNIISDTLTLSIAKKVFTRKGIEPIFLKLSYDYNKKEYIWTISNIITKNKDFRGKDTGEAELLELDAFTAKQISYYPNALYGPVY